MFLCDIRPALTRTLLIEGVMELVFHLNFFYFHIYFMLNFSFLCHVLGCGKGGGNLVFLRHLDGPMTGSSELAVVVQGSSSCKVPA